MLCLNGAFDGILLVSRRGRYAGTTYNETAPMRFDRGGDDMFSASAKNEAPGTDI